MGNDAVSPRRQENEVRQTLARRVLAYAGLAWGLWFAGVTAWSVVAFPVRRRRDPQRSQLDLRSGLSIRGPRDEPLPHVFLENWAHERYAVKGINPRADEVILDLGAHVGVFSMWATTRFPQTRVLAFEPTSETHRYLRKNIQLNRLKNVTAIQAACGKTAGEAQLYSRGPGAMNSLYHHDNYGSRFEPLEHVPVLTLSGVFRDHAIARCALLKLDCEGAEYEILLSTPRSVMEKIQAIALEYHIGLNPHTPAELVVFLQSCGFEVECQPLLDIEGGYLYAWRKNSGPAASA